MTEIDAILEDIIQSVIETHEESSGSMHSSNSSFEDLALGDVIYDGVISGDEWSLADLEADRMFEEEEADVETRSEVEYSISDESLVILPRLVETVTCDMCAELDLGFEEDCIHSRLVLLREKRRELSEIESCISQVCHTIIRGEKLENSESEDILDVLTETERQATEDEDPEAMTVLPRLEDGPELEEGQSDIRRQEEVQYSGYFLTRAKLHLWLRT